MVFLWSVTTRAARSALRYCFSGQCVSCGGLHDIDAKPGFIHHLHSLSESFRPILTKPTQPCSAMVLTWTQPTQVSVWTLTLTRQQHFLLYQQNGCFLEQYPYLHC